MKNQSKNNPFYSEIIGLLHSARSEVMRTVNRTMVVTYFEIGRLIVEEEQGGEDRAKYGKQLIKELSKVLIKEFGKGFSLTNIKQMRRFYLVYHKSQTASAVFKEEIGQTLSDQFNLSWSHYLKLMRIDIKEERKFYEIEAVNNNWSIRELKRQYDSALYTRLALSRNKSESVVRYTLPEDNEQVLASKYDTVLPNKEELKNLLQEPAARYYKIQKTMS